MRHLNIDAEEAHLFQRLAGRVLYSDPSLRPRSHVLAMNTKAQSSLWVYGISGDVPIVLVRIGQSEHLDTVRQLLRGHEYLRLRGLQFDLVILNDHPPSYVQELHEELLALIRSSGAQSMQDKPGGVFLRRTDVMPDRPHPPPRGRARRRRPRRGSLEEQWCAARRRGTARLLCAADAFAHLPERMSDAPTSFLTASADSATGGRVFDDAREGVEAARGTTASPTTAFGFQVTETVALRGRRTAREPPYPWRTTRE